MAVLHPAPDDLLPYYLRGPDGQFTGEEFATEDAAVAAAADHDGVTVHLDLYVVGDRSWSAATEHRRLAPRDTVTPAWKPRGWGGTD